MANLFRSGLEVGGLGIFNTVSGSATISNVESRTGYYSLYINDREYVGISLTTNPQEIYCRVAFYKTGEGSSSPYSVFTLRDAEGWKQLAFNINTSNQIEIRRGDYNDVLLATSSTAISDDVWNCFELHIKIDNSSGIIQVKQNGTTVIDFSGDTQDSGNSNVGTFFIGASPDSTYYHANGYFDDIAINDTTGSTNNSWVGRGGIIGLKPNGAGAYTQFTPNTGDNYAAVDEVPADDDTTYVQTNVQGYKDLYTFENLPAGTYRIDAVTWIAKAKQVEAGESQLEPLFRQDGTDYGYTFKSLGTDYAYITHTLETSPDGTEWDSATVNAIEAGYKAAPYGS